MIHNKFVTGITSGFLMGGLLLGGLAAAPAGAAPVPGAGVGMTAPVVASVRSIAPMAKTKPRASVSATWDVVAGSKVKVAVTSNAKKVKLAYRTTKGTKRTATIKVRNGVGARTLAKGSTKIKAQALATSKLRASRWMTVPKVVAPVVPTTPTTPTTPTSPSSPTAPSVLRFNLAGAVGVALAPNPLGTMSASSTTVRASATDGSLVAVGADGSMWNAMTSGTTKVNGYVMGPDGFLYVMFRMPTDVNTGEYGTCSLARVDRGSGVATCVDTTQIYLNSRTFRGNPAIQFDSSGAVYYSARSASTGASILRRYSGGVITDLINDQVSLNDFLVLPDDRVIVTGYTNATSAGWTRMLNPGGGIQTLLGTQAANFLRVSPDGNIYLGVGSPSSGVRRFLTASNEMDPKYWISGYSGAGTPDTYFNTADLPECTTVLPDPFCGSRGAYIGESHNVDGKTFVRAGDLGEGVLMQYFPTLARPTTSVSKLMVLSGSGSKLALAGLDAADRNRLTLFDTQTGTESVLLDTANDVEIYHLDYASASGRIMFDGLRFADGKYVLGQIDTETGQITMTPTGQSKWVDFQTF